MLRRLECQTRRFLRAAVRRDKKAMRRLWETCNACHWVIGRYPEPREIADGVSKGKNLDDMFLDTTAGWRSGERLDYPNASRWELDAVWQKDDK